MNPKSSPTSPYVIFNVKMDSEFFSTSPLFPFNIKMNSDFSVIPRPVPFNVWMNSEFFPHYFSNECILFLFLLGGLGRLHSFNVLYTKSLHSFSVAFCQGILTDP